MRSVDRDRFLRELVNLLSHTAAPIALYVEAVFRGRSSGDRCDSDRFWGDTLLGAQYPSVSAEIGVRRDTLDNWSRRLLLAVCSTTRQGQRVNHDAALRPVFDPAGSERPDSTFEPVLNTEEAAALLQIHPKTLQRMARQGVVPAFRIGDLWRFRASDLDRWLRSGLCSKGHSCR